ncbi:outer membrane usher protein [Erwinia sp. SLM-02]|nr:outer membrane usher protein [uncultured Erwinia sp.]
MMTPYNLRGLSARPHILGLMIGCILSAAALTAQSQDFKFNIDVLDVNDRKNIDLDQFSRAGFIMPGNYTMSVNINQQQLREQPVSFYAPDNDPKGSEACITPELVEQIGLRDKMKAQLTWWHQGQCLTVDSLKGMVVKSDLPTTTVYLNIPQAYLEYSSDDWDPPSRWDNGIPGLLFDYNVNGQGQRQSKSGEKSYDVSGNGTLGANLGVWRFRADWQSRYNHQSGNNSANQFNWDWSRYYAYRAITRLGAKLTLGENYLNSDIFDSFRFSGVTLATDDAMLPPNLRGYAPEVTGVAKTNAKVVISQQGRILQQTQVASGAFRIQDINDAVTGKLDVRVEEQDGSVQEFSINTANIPYLTRPGTIRYKISSGRPTDWRHHVNGPMFGSGEFSWGINNGWSLYGGGVSDGRYNALALGIGRDLLFLGALSFDATQSRAKLPHSDDLYSGGSYRLSYSKRFDDYDSQVTFAGYRFSQKNYMSMSEYLDARVTGVRSQNSKEMYTITFNQQFRDAGLSAYLNFNHQTYWDRPDNDRYDVTLSSYFDIGRLKNLSLSLTAFRNKYDGHTDDGMYLSLSLPIGNDASLSYNGSWGGSDNTNRASYYKRVDEHNNYQVSSGFSHSKSMASGYYSHEGDIATVDANATYQEGDYSSVGLSIQGGATATLKGAALHRTSIVGGTRILLDTDGVAGVPISGYGSSSTSNRFGKVVLADVSNYYRNQLSIDLNKMPDNAEVIRSVAQATLTEGAIGYRTFEVISGEKAMAVLRLADGSTPPFGATVKNSKNQSVGIVNDGGSVYLSGIKSGEVMKVFWDGQEKCELPLPEKISINEETNLLLPCHTLASNKR